MQGNRRFITSNKKVKGIRKWKLKNNLILYQVYVIFKARKTCVIIFMSPGLGWKCPTLRVQVSGSAIFWNFCRFFSLKLLSKCPYPSPNVKCLTRVLEAKWRVMVTNNYISLFGRKWEFNTPFPWKQSRLNFFAPYLQFPYFQNVFRIWSCT